MISAVDIACEKTNAPPTLPPTSPSSGTPAPEIPAFDAAWPELESRLKSADTATREALVDPAIGLYVFDNPGAYMILGKVTNLAAAPRGIPDLKGCVVKRAERLPTYSCETDQWSAQGCLHVAKPPVPMVQVVKTQIVYVEDRAMTDEDRQHFAELERIERLITDAVFYKGIVYFFGPVDGTWRLIALDVVSPCSA